MSLKTEQEYLVLIASLNQNITSLQSEINAKDDYIIQLTQQLNKSKRKIFGSSTEKVNIDQLCLFTEFDDTITETKKPEKQKRVLKQVKKLNEQVIDKVTDIKEYFLDDLTCPTCSELMHHFKYDSTYSFTYIPAKVEVTEHRVYRAVCDNCNEVKSTIVKANGPDQIIYKSIATPSLIADMIIEKFQYHMPLYRLEDKYKNELGFEISRQVMSNWINKITIENLTPICDNLIDQLKSCDIMHADETTVSVVNHPKKTICGCM